ncbi:DinB family protein [Mucilaginibacter myungsuensis]|uniref:DinB family protein n=1 Tax=Mucilaginibacter myungsuensis TaxID=649104 RepID=A0A929KZ22_9SPHI|nr:DinB family protein [Mucilaginibacter myungsuensis]MBE9664329.1 DinB family protein [Mucilaginibacter myungsuensis]MDN3597038.1 DinB family protein [Mucilaginibacter myungsuensis]
MNDIIFAENLALELSSEAPSTIKCLEHIQPEHFGFKPHERSMEMGYLAMLVGDIPNWIYYIIEKGEVNFATYEHVESKDGAAMVERFESNIEAAKKSLASVTEGSLDEPFYLKKGDEELLKSTKREQLESVINHMVHHRGQLTVYMRMNDIPVPATYGPSADDRSYGFKS